MTNSDFISYLNTLHNVNANNPSAYTEMVISSPYFKETMVNRPVGDYIQQHLNQEKPLFFILTGHAGDGKTAIMFQTMQTWGVIPQDGQLKEISDVTMPCGRICRCVKDFSELESSRRKQLFEELRNCLGQGISVFLVANTGPLISTFNDIMGDEETARLVGAIDDNNGVCNDYNGVPIVVINVAAVDNSCFVTPYLDRVLATHLWEPCKECKKAPYCPIYMNYQMMSRGKEHVASFIEKHYIWQQEYGNKLTVRQIVAHLSFTITGGLNCRQVRDSKGFRFRHLCSNRFFGYRGIKPDVKAASVKAIADILDFGYDQKRLKADEELFINGEYSCFDSFTRNILEEDAVDSHYRDGWQQAVRRAYIFLNIESREEKCRQLDQDIFSRWFPRYLELRKGAASSFQDKDLLTDALKMLFLGSLQSGQAIPVTMSRGESSPQCVQLVYDTVLKNNIKLIPEKIEDFSNVPRKRLRIEIKGQKLSTPLSLPLINHFEEMRRGAIQTYIDPQLSQGIDSLRAQIIALSQTDAQEIQLLVMSQNGWESITAAQDDNCWVLI